MKASFLAQAHRASHALLKSLLGRLLGMGPLSRNTFAALCQAVLVSGSMFLVYRVVVQNAGLEQLGIWSLLMAGSTLARASDISGAGGLGRFIAMIGAGRDMGGDIVEITHTIVLTSIAINASFGGLLYLIGPYVLRLALPDEMMEEAISLIPYLVATVVLGGLSGAVTSGIDGTQRIDHRAAVVSFGAISMLLMAVVLVPQLGIYGFAIAQVFSQVITVIIGWVVLRWHVPEIGWQPYRWRPRAFRASATFGVKLNLISVLTLLFEPLVKFSFNAAGGPTQVAYFELATRVITQTRGLVVAASIPLVPAIASLSDNEWQRREELLSDAIKVTSLAAVGTAASSICLTPLVSYLVLGAVSEPLLYISIPLIFAWSIHLPSVPIYLAAQTDGRMRWNGISHLVLALAVLAGVVLATWGFPHAVLISIVVGLLLSAATVFAGNIPMLGLQAVAAKSVYPLVLSACCITALSLLALITFSYLA